MPKFLSIGGYIAASILVVLGLAMVVVGFVGRSYVTDQLANEQIVGSPDMTPQAIQAEAKDAGLKPDQYTVPSCSVANQKVDTGAEAKCFADYMRIHTLEATGGQTYAQMPRYATADGKGTNDATAALKGPGGKPQDNAQRDIWVTETALTNALYTSYFAENVALFAIIVGFALLLIGVGLAILTMTGIRRSSAAAGAPAQAVTA